MYAGSDKISRRGEDRIDPLQTNGSQIARGSLKNKGSRQMICPNSSLYSISDASTQLPCKPCLSRSPISTTATGLEKSIVSITTSSVNMVSRRFTKPIKKPSPSGASADLGAKQGS